MRKHIMLGIMVVFMAGCTDACRAKVQALGDPAMVVCYSGGEVIYEGCSTGKVQSEENSDGYFFRSKDDGLPKEVSGNCVIRYSHRVCR